jgi:hypothetical protein
MKKVTPIHVFLFAVLLLTDKLNAAKINSLEGAATSVVNLDSRSLTLSGGGYNTTFSGVIQGSGRLNVQGINGSTLVLLGVNDYTGMTFLTGGAFVRAKDGTHLPLHHPQGQRRA